MAQHGHDTHVICLRRGQDSCTETDDGVQVHFVVPKRVKPRRLVNYASRLPGLGELREAYFGWNLVENSLGIWHKVRNLERQLPFDVIQCSDFGGQGFFGVWPAKRSRPIVIRGNGLVSMYLQSGGWPGARFQYKLEEICGQKAHFVLAETSWLTGVYRSQFNVPESHLGVLCRPFDITHTIEEMRLRIAPSELPVVLYVGRIEYGKGCDILFQALENVKRAVPEVRVSLIGKSVPELESRLKAFLQNNGEWVTHYGHLLQPEVFQHMLSSTMLVLPSRMENAGNVLAEAQFCGLPQVASRVGGIPEYVEDGYTGLLVPPEDVEALAEAIIRLCLSPELCTTMGQRSRELAHARYGVDAVMTRFVRVCDALVAGRSPAAILHETWQNPKKDPSPDHDRFGDSSGAE